MPPKEASLRRRLADAKSEFETAYAAFIESPQYRRYSQAAEHFAQAQNEAILDILIEPASDTAMPVKGAVAIPVADLKIDPEAIKTALDKDAVSSIAFNARPQIRLLLLSDDRNRFDTGRYAVVGKTGNSYFLTRVDSAEDSAVARDASDGPFSGKIGIDVDTGEQVRFAGEAETIEVTIIADRATFAERVRQLKASNMPTDLAVVKARMETGYQPPAKKRIGGRSALATETARRERGVVKAGELGLKFGAIDAAVHINLLTAPTDPDKPRIAVREIITIQDRKYVATQAPPSLGEGVYALRRIHEDAGDFVEVVGDDPWANRRIAHGSHPYRIGLERETCYVMD